MELGGVDQNRNQMSEITSFEMVDSAIDYHLMHIECNTTNIFKRLQ